MERIDTINARPDVNGVGKKGFHDNADLSGQDATYISPEWCNHVQEEIANVIEGFGEALNPAQKNQVYMVVKGINDRTTAIENFIENIVDYFYPVGVIIDFGIPDFNPNVKYVGTTWVRHGEGQASVGLSTQESDPAWTKTVGNEFGEYEHTLTTDELPSFRLESGVVMSSGTIDTNAAAYGTKELASPTGNSIMADGGACDVTALTSSIGNEQPHNNVQPSVVDARWRRTA
jgi:microcystin-dependent protein